MFGDAGASRSEDAENLRFRLLAGFGSAAPSRDNGRATVQREMESARGSIENDSEDPKIRSYHRLHRLQPIVASPPALRLSADPVLWLVLNLPLLIALVVYSLIVPLVQLPVPFVLGGARSTLSFHSSLSRCSLLQCLGPYWAHHGFGP